MPTKYRAKKVTVDGIRFDSIKESHRYLELKTLQQAGVITNLELQPRYDVVVNGQKICYYKADFRYMENGAQVIEDVKGMRTPIYRLKKKLVEALYPIKIIEV